LPSSITGDPAISTNFPVIQHTTPSIITPRPSSTERTSGPNRSSTSVSIISELLKFLNQFLRFTERLADQAILKLSEKPGIKYELQNWPPLPVCQIAISDRPTIVNSFLRAAALVGSYYPFGYYGNYQKKNSAESEAYDLLIIRVFCAFSMEFESFYNSNYQFVMTVVRASVCSIAKVN
jgi:hypothetical protein